MAGNLNIEKARKLLQSFDFKNLFIEELGWSIPKSAKKVTQIIKYITIYRQAIAELSGAVVFEITTPDGVVPEPKQRLIIAKEIQKLHYENVLIFIDKERKGSIWHWLKTQDKKLVSREHFFFSHQPGDGFISKIASLVVDISEFDKEGNIAIAEVASRIKAALDIERVVKKFYRDYQQEYIVFLQLIEGIDNEADRRWYASVILNRLMFIYFLQKKLFLDNGDEKYLNNKLLFSKQHLGKNKFYSEFLNILFFEGFAKHEHDRTSGVNKLIGKIKYLNGGLFLEHKIESKYKGRIRIPDKAFDNLFTLFDRYSWTLDDTPGGADNEMNPDVLGYIFEKYINQKAFGAYYTRTEITEYLCEQTIYKLILDEVNSPEIDPELLKKAGLDRYGKLKHYTGIAELLLDLDAPTCRKLIVGDSAVLTNLSLLDPACGSGAFLVAAMKTLINVYSAILGKIDFLGDIKLTEWKKNIEQSHPSINYYIKKQIITNNLYGVDLMEEATEIAKLRLFLALVSSAGSEDQLEPLPNIDFNIMCGNSLIGLMRVDESEYNKHQSGDLFKKSYRELVNTREAAIHSFKSADDLDDHLQIKKLSIDKMEEEAKGILNLMLGHEFSNLGIKYDQVSWDEKKNKEGKPLKRSITLKDIKELEPFHWGYEFSAIFRKKNGFDAIITNPPWEVFQTNEKEFFQQYDIEIKKKKLRIEDWEKGKEELMVDQDIRQAWLDYSSKYPHQWAYFKNAHQYKNQITIINGKAVGNKPNLYCLFLEQCKNLLHKGGYCGIVIPSGIYTDLGTKQLREMLFDETQVTGLFCFENRKEIFENVHRSFKFVVLSFEKGGVSIKFPAAFMRHDVEDLDNFPQNGSICIAVELVKKLSPDSYSIIEFKNENEVKIAEKISIYPLLYGAEEGWNLELYGEEINMTRSSSIFLTSKSKFTLYEGGMIHQFNSSFSGARYWINEKEIREDFLNKRIKRIDGLKVLPPDIKNDYEDYRLAIRKIARNTDSRTLIATVLPRYSLAGNSLTVNFPFFNDAKRYNLNRLNSKELLILTATLNSFTVDYILRSRVSANLNLFYLYQLPVPRINVNNRWYDSIVIRTAKLICTNEDYAELWNKAVKTKWNENVSAKRDSERNKLRAELDGIIAHVYGLTEEEFAYILSTFPLVPQSQIIAAQNAYRDVERGLIK